MILLKRRTASKHFLYVLLFGFPKGRHEFAAIAS